jgi:ribose transport system ATP-binding protein
MNKKVLQLNNITKSFAQVKVLSDVSLSVEKGQVVGLVGENGAGKSTLMNILGGVYHRDSGEILLNGKPFLPREPKDSTNAGIAFVQQELNLFSNLTVAENLFITNIPKFAGPFVNPHAMKKEAKRKLLQINIDDISPDAIVGTLPMGQRQLVEITKAIVGDADIIIFDEPTTSLSTKEKQKLFEIIEHLRKAGKSIIFISHILNDVFKYCDEIVVLRDGKVITQVPAKDISLPGVVKMMVGRELNNIYPAIEKEIGGVIFEGRSISQEGRFNNVSISIRKGEIVGLFGLMGSGRTEYLRCLFGVDPVTAGTVMFEGNPVRNLKPETCTRLGMAFITENRREEGLLMTKTVRENIVLASLKELSPRAFGFMLSDEEQKMTRMMVDELKVRTYDPSMQMVINLSGGNQQKVVFSKWVSRRPKVFLLDEPTRGIDVGAKYEIYGIMNDLAKNKSAILLVSSEMEELMGMCDRILVMCKNRIVAEFPKGQYNQEKIMLEAIGGGVNE